MGAADCVPLASPSRAPLTPTYNCYVATEKLSRQKIDFVLRRAAEIEASRALEDHDVSGGDSDLTVRELVRLGEEAGLASDAIVRALAEARRGGLKARETDTLAKTIGPSRLVISREVPGPTTPVQRAVERFLREQLMTVRRHHGDRIEWERAQGIWPGLVRSLDFSKRYALAPVSRIDTVVTAEAEDLTAVTFEIDLSESRRRRATRIFARAAAALGIVGVGGSALFPGFGVNDLLALFSGGAVAGGFFALERRRYQETRERVQLSPERFLDLLVQRRRRALDRGEANASVGDDAEPDEAG